MAAEPVFDDNSVKKDHQVLYMQKQLSMAWKLN